MENIKNLTLKDGGRDKNFVLTKMKALPLLKYTNTLLGSIADNNPDFTLNAFSQFVANIMETGVTTNVDNDEINKVIDSLAKKGIVPFIFEMIKSLLINSKNPATQDLLIEPLVKCIRFYNGVDLMQFTTQSGGDNDINIHIEEAGTLYKLFFEILKLNYIDFFKKKVTNS